MAMLVLPFVMIATMILVIISSMLLSDEIGRADDGRMVFFIFSVVIATLVALGMMVSTLNTLKFYEIRAITLKPITAEKP